VASVVPDLEPRIKWPNDVQVGGRKVCGVLCEAAGSREVVAGVGINVRQKASDFPFEIRDRAVSLEEASGRRVSRSTLVGALLGEIRGLFREGIPWLCGSLALEFRRRDALYGLRVRASAGCQGVAAGVDSSGALLVDVGDSVVRVACGSARVEEERLPPDVSQPNPSE
jgi:BirA family biotin operon repressor/biotin-[acetyl-CoA-carboxylase] ligase